MEAIKKKNKPVGIFLHIPKAAGTTLGNIVRWNYNHGLVFRSIGLQEDEEYFRALSVEEKEKYSLIWGHFRFGIHQYLTKPYAYFTVLREPVDRILSLYYYIRRSPEHYLYHQVKGMDLKEFVSYEHCSELADAQTRFLAGRIDAYPRNGIFSSCNLSDLEHAKYHLQRDIATFGVMEHFDESVLIMAKELGWRKIYYDRKLNATTDRVLKPDISADVVSIIEERNRIDRDLYEYAQQKFSEIIEQQGIGFHVRLRRFCILNQLNQRINHQVHTRRKALGVIKSNFTKWFDNLASR
jgi:hypothetical protein